MLLSHDGEAAATVLSQSSSIVMVKIDKLFAGTLHLDARVINLLQLLPYVETMLVGTCKEPSL